jgi:hypothetical protein
MHRRSDRTPNLLQRLIGQPELSARPSLERSALYWTTKVSNSARVEPTSPSNPMSLETKDSFKRWVTDQQVACADELCLLPPVFVDEGYTTTAFMSASGGKVELTCGPAEYNVEMFIHDKAAAKRLTFSDLLALPLVLEWLQVNQPNNEGKQRIEGKIEYAFRLLKGAIAQVPEMRWLLRSSSPNPDSPPQAPRG